MWFEKLINDKISEAKEHDDQYQTTLNQVRDSQSLVTKIPWLRHTRWEEIFIGKDMSELVKLSNAPGMQDHHERRIWDATGRVIHACFKGVLDCQKRGWALIPVWFISQEFWGIISNGNSGASHWNTRQYWQAFSSVLVSSCWKQLCQG